ncbi:MAG: hypothetical protein P8127_00720 [Acidobacteriota bacterium]
MQLWNQRLSADGTRIAAVVADSFGSWTVAVDGRAWSTSFNDLVLPPVFSPDGRRVAAGVRHDGAWNVAVDGAPWPETYDMVWDPVFTPDGDRVLAKVEREGRFAVAIDGVVRGQWYEGMWEPVISSDGQRLLVRAVDQGVYIRHVMQLNEMS